MRTSAQTYAQSFHLPTRTAIEADGTRRRMTQHEIAWLVRPTVPLAPQTAEDVDEIVDTQLKLELT
jgi:hypothetical protein